MRALTRTWQIKRCTVTSVTHRVFFLVQQGDDTSTTALTTTTNNTKNIDARTDLLADSDVQNYNNQFTTAKQRELEREWEREREREWERELESEPVDMLSSALLNRSIPFSSLSLPSTSPPAYFFAPSRVYHRTGYPHSSSRISSSSSFPSTSASYYYPYPSSGVIRAPSNRIPIPKPQERWRLSPEQHHQQHTSSSTASTTSSTPRTQTGTQQHPSSVSSSSDYSDPLMQLRYGIPGTSSSSSTTTTSSSLPSTQSQPNPSPRPFLSPSTYEQINQANRLQYNSMQTRPPWK